MEKETKTAIILAVIVGLIYLFPHLVYLSQPGTYNPLYISQNRGFMDEAIYSAGVQEVLEGNLIPTDLTVFEHKHGLMIYGPLPFIIMAILAKLFGGLTPLLIISDFIFSALTFIIFYILAKKITSSHNLSLIGSVLLLFFYRIFIPPPTITFAGLKTYLTSIFLNTAQGNANFWLSRFMHPQITLPLLLLTILIIWKAFETKHKLYFLASAILLAANVYSYFYNWTYLFVFCTIFSLMMLVYIHNKEGKYQEHISQKETPSQFLHPLNKKLFLALIGTIFLLIILCIPYLLNTIQIQDMDITARSGIEYTQAVEPISVVFVLLILLIFTILLVKRKNNSTFTHRITQIITKMDQPSIVLLTLLLSSIIVLNIQLILGYTIQNDHYYSRILVPIVILSILWILSSSKFITTILQKKYITPVILLLLCTSAIIVHINEIRGQSPYYSFSPEEQELLTYLQSLPPNSVILTSNITWNLWIPAYTSADLFFPYSASTIASKEELENRFIFTFTLLNYTSSEVESLLLTNSSYTRIPNSPPPTSLQTYMRSYIYLDEIYPVEKQGTLKGRIFNQEPVNELIKKYATASTSPPALESQGQMPYHQNITYKLDYILLTKEESKRKESIEKTLNLSGLTVEKVFGNSELLLLKISQQ